LSELDRLKKERQEMAAAVKQEMARLRAENEALRRGVAHQMQKQTFLKPTRCMHCKSFVLGKGGFVCSNRNGGGAQCRFLACTRCVDGRKVPNNCIGLSGIDLSLSVGSIKKLAKSKFKSPPMSPRSDDEEDDDGVGNAPKAEHVPTNLDLAALLNGATVLEGVLQHKDLSSGRWHKQYALIKSGLLLVYGSEKDSRKSPHKMKEMFLLYDSHLVSYAKDKKSREFSFGVESKNSVIWLDAGKSSHSLETWLEAINGAVLHSANAGKVAEARLNELFHESKKKGTQLEKEIVHMRSTADVKRSNTLSEDKQ